MPSTETTSPAMAPAPMPATPPAMPPAASPTIMSPSFGDRPRTSGHPPCDLRTTVSDPSEIARIRGQTPQEIAAEVVGDHETRLQWATLIPPFEGGAAEERATVSLAFPGEARRFPRCQNLVELDMWVGVRSESGVLAFEGRARFTSPRRGAGEITTDFPKGGVEPWNSSSNFLAWKKEIESSRGSA